MNMKFSMSYLKMNLKSALQLVQRWFSFNTDHGQSPDGNKRGGADAPSLCYRLVMQVVKIAKTNLK